MSIAEPVTEIKQGPTLADRVRRFDQLLEAIGERISSLVVKEARQALKSKQFTLTFFLLLICAAGWTMIGIALSGSGRYESEGMQLMLGYYAILCVPMIVIVPFSTYRSLAAEREDGTFELLSITTLSARQIALGKLAAAIMQMCVYYSALAPCIAFTYLLRGIDFITIALFLAYLFLISTLLCSASLLVAVITKAKHWQVLFSVALVGGLILLCFGWINLTAEILSGFQRNSAFSDPVFWMLQLAMFTLHPQLVWLFTLAAAGSIGFTSENRSTPIRFGLVALTITWFGWVTYFAAASRGEPFVLIPGMIIAWLAWTVFGSLMVGERAELSPRMRRALPQSFVGRLAFTWFNPGSGTGYVFTIITYAALCAGLAAVGAMIEFFQESRNSFMYRNYPIGAAVGAIGIVTTSYLANYLGFVRFLVLLLRKRVEDTVSFAFALMVVTLGMGIVVPIALQFTLFDESNYLNDYSFLQVTNPVWTIGEFLRHATNGNTTSAYAQLIAAVWLVGLAAIPFFTANFVSAVREVVQTRLVAPTRLLAEDAAIAAAHAPQAKKKGPWDDSEWNVPTKPHHDSAHP